VDADVVVVGAGAAGGVLALELARRGLRVTVLESGPRHDPAKRWDGVRRWLRHENPWERTPKTLDRYTVGGPQPYQLEGRRARGVGGSTLHWEGYALRLHASDFMLRSLHGVGDDWPIRYDDLEPYYAAAERSLGVAGTADDPWASPRSAPYPLPAFPFSHSDGLFSRACRTLGIGLHHLPQARNSVAYDGRPQCRACGTCFVCPTGAKATADLTHVAAAEATGNARVVTEATVKRLVTDDAGEVRAAVYAGPDGVERRAEARVFVLAGGAVENARLLLLSTSRRFPAGLANGSGLVGKCFMTHPSVTIQARVRDRVHPYRIGFSTAMTRQFAVGGDRGRRGAFLLEFLNAAGPTPEQIAVASGRWGADLREHVRAEFGRWMGIRIYAEELPERTNAVTLNPRVRDALGVPAPHIHHAIGAYERAALEEAREVVGRIMTALGALEVKPGPLSFAGHQMGTHRMGTDPRTSVVDPDQRAHEVPNLYLAGGGCFVTGSASPPTLTIVALAIRTAERIAARLAPPGRPSARAAGPGGTPAEPGAQRDATPA